MITFSATIAKEKSTRPNRINSDQADQFIKEAIERGHFMVELPGMVDDECGQLLLDNGYTIKSLPHSTLISWL